LELVRQPFDDPQGFEKTTPPGQSAISRQGFVRARDREFARQGIQGNFIPPFTRQVNGNYRCRWVHRPSFY
jgi:hypothetical protein